MAEIQVNEATYNPLLVNLLSSTKRVVLNYGGAGSGKSVSMTQCFILFALQRKTKLLVVRKIASTLQDSVINEFIERLNEWGVNYKIVGRGSDCKITIFPTKSVILFKGLDNVNKLTSIGGIEKVYCEEVLDKRMKDDITSEDFDQLQTRIRGKNLVHPQLFLVFNPTSKNSWVYKRYFELGTDCEIYHTTYHDNKFLDDDYKNVLEEHKVHDYNFYRIFCLGEFGFVTQGDELYKNFNPNIVKDTVLYNNEAPLHITFDENTAPYLTCLISQIDGNSVNVVDEITIPKLNLEAVCKEIISRYGGHNAGMYIYGDASSRKKLTTTGFYEETFYSLVLKHLERFNPINRVATSNPSVVLRTSWINKLLYYSSNGGSTEVNISVSPKCKRLIDDWTCVRTAPDGTKDKSKTRVDGQSIELHGHASDAFEYFIVKAFNSLYNKYINPSSSMIFRKGGKVQF